VNLTTTLGAALAVALLWGGFATQRWISADARCDTRVTQAELDAVNAERERADHADKDGAKLFKRVRSGVTSDLLTAKEATSTRSATMRTVSVSGECRMPAGLPSLSPAVKEARDAAAD
jgi:hypothetical protein